VAERRDALLEKFSCWLPVDKLRPCGARVRDTTANLYRVHPKRGSQTAASITATQQSTCS
jgi:hypothetical protein